MDTPTICTIQQSISETHDIRTLRFHYDKLTIPGQFFMIWIPGIDEIPMSISYIDEHMKGITFRTVGEATTMLSYLKKGDRLGIRGPYGHGFEYIGNHLLFVGGGTGIAMIAPAIELVRQMKKRVTCVLGAKTKEELFFAERIKHTGAMMSLSTDDGSLGKKGFASDIAIDVIKTENIDAVYTCGPELMMRLLFDQSGDLPFQASLERYMKCGVGLCGQCCVDGGIRVCFEGPVFDRQSLLAIDDFGVWKRDASGKKILF